MFFSGERLKAKHQIHFGFSEHSGSLSDKNGHSQMAKKWSCEFSESVGLRGRLLRRVNALKAEQNGSEAPDHFLCPITRELMKDPVIAAGWCT